MEKLRQSKLIKIMVVVAVMVIAMMFGNVVNAGAINQAGETAGYGAENVSAEATSSKSIGDILKAGSEWISGGKESVKGFGSTPEDFVSEFIGIGQILVAVGVVVLVIVAIITAIRWLTATPDKQAKLKVQLIGLVVSIIVIFGAVGIWNFVRGVLSRVETDPNMLGSNANNNTVIVSNR